MLKHEVAGKMRRILNSRRSTVETVDFKIVTAFSLMETEVLQYIVDNNIDMNVIADASMYMRNLGLDGKPITIAEANHRYEEMIEFTYPKE